MSAEASSPNKRKASAETMKAKKAKVADLMAGLSSGNVTDVSDFLKTLASEKAEQEASISACKKFVKNGNGHRLGGDCGICWSPLLDNIDSQAFGITSYRCVCSVNRLIHVR